MVVRSQNNYRTTEILSGVVLALVERMVRFRRLIQASSGRDRLLPGSVKKYPLRAGRLAGILEMVEGGGTPMWCLQDQREAGKTSMGIWFLRMYLKNTEVRGIAASAGVIGIRSAAQLRRPAL